MIKSKSIFKKGLEKRKILRGLESACVTMVSINLHMIYNRILLPPCDLSCKLKNWLFVMWKLVRIIVIQDHVIISCVRKCVTNLRSKVRIEVIRIVASYKSKSSNFIQRPCLNELFTVLCKENFGCRNFKKGSSYFLPSESFSILFKCSKLPHVCRVEL